MKLPTYPFKITKSLEIFSLIIVIGSWIASFYFYQMLPELVVSHWNIQGVADGYSSRGMGAFALPAIITVAYLLFLILPSIDPQKNRYADFGRAYQAIKIAVLGMLAAIYIIASLVNIGYQIPIQIVVPILVGLLFVVIGSNLGNVKKNYFVGIRTPWTLSSEDIWNKTNSLAGTLFILAGVAIVLSVFLNPTMSFVVLMLAILIAALVPVLYSYLLWRKESSHNSTQ